MSKRSIAKEDEPAVKKVKGAESVDQPKALAAWEDVFALDFGCNWHLAYASESEKKKDAQIGWIKQLIGVHLALPEEKTFAKINKDIKFAERHSAFGAVLDEHTKVLDCLLQSFLNRNPGKTCNPFSYLPTLQQPSLGAKLPVTQKAKPDIKANAEVCQSAFLHVTAGFTLALNTAEPFVIGRGFSQLLDEGDGIKKGDGKEVLSLNLKNLPGCDKISRYHANIVWKDGNWYLVNRSSFGTIVDDVLFNGEAPLRHGSVCKIGSQYLTFYHNPRS